MKREELPLVPYCSFFMKVVPPSPARGVLFMWTMQCPTIPFPSGWGHGHEESQSRLQGGTFPSSSVQRERLLLTQSCDDFAVTGCQLFSYLFRSFTKLVIVHNLHWILIIQEEVLFSAFDVLRENFNVKVKVAQLFPTLCDQARILEWVAIPFSRGSS